MRKSHNFIITSGADLEIADAYVYYEFKQLKLGERFLRNLEECFHAIDTNPFTYKVEFDDFRQAKINKFPCVVIYKIKGMEIIILSVFNTYQNPIKKTK